MLVTYNENAKKELKKLDPSTREQILSYMKDISTLSDPRSRGKALTGSLSSLWRYRVGKYRIVCEISDSQLVVLVVLVIDISKRDVVYKKENQKIINYKQNKE